MLQLRKKNTALTTGEQKTVDRAMEVLDRAAKRQGSVFSSISMVKKYFKTRLSGLSKEKFEVAFLDTGLRLIECETMFDGSADYVHVDVTEITRKALTLNATRVILAHNHPSGNANASDGDKLLTKEIKGVLSQFDIVLCDHIIVADGKTPFSMSEANLL